MKHALRAVFLWLALLGLAHNAFAGSGTYTITDQSSTTRTFSVVTDGSGNFVGREVICDQSAAAQCVSVKAASTAAAATDLGLVVSISPNGAPFGATGSAVPATGDYNGFNGSGNLTGLIGCDNSILYDASTSGATQLVALSAGKKVYVCGYTIFSAGTVNVDLRYGTGTACATGGTKITPAFQLTAQTGVVEQSIYGNALATIASNELCINTSGAVAVQALVRYTQL